MCWFSTSNIEEVVSCHIMWYYMWYVCGKSFVERDERELLIWNIIKEDKRPGGSPQLHLHHLHTIYTLHYTHTASCNMDTQHTGELTNFWIQQYLNTHRWHPHCVIVGKFSSSTEAELAWGCGPDNGSKLRDCSENRSCTLQISCTCRYTASIVHLQICGKYSAPVDV